MDKNYKLQIESKCVHSGIKDYEHGPVIPPIYQTSTFKFLNLQITAVICLPENKKVIFTPEC